MKLQTIEKKREIKSYSALTIGEVYSQTSKIGLREATNYYLRTQAGMVNLESGNFIPYTAYIGSSATYAGLGFEHVPNAKFVV